MIAELPFCLRTLHKIDPHFCNSLTHDKHDAGGSFATPCIVIPQVPVGYKQETSEHKKPVNTSEENFKSATF